MGYDRLAPQVQRWVHDQGWPSLRYIQEAAIEPILGRKTDLVISAATAAGKTEAAFLPACSNAVSQTEGFGILYISPLKALINDQYRRLSLLCERLDMPITPWHGDSAQRLKTAARRDPRGILMITPESLEATLLRQTAWAASAFESLQYVIIDEYHSFIGTERGHQLISLLTRVEELIEGDAEIPRIALSATLGEMSAVTESLRPCKLFPCTLIEDDSPGAGLKMQIRGYLSTPPPMDDPDALDLHQTADEQIANELFHVLRSSSNLVFANSRQRTERFAVMLSDRCASYGVPNEFFPHHGSLSKDLREELEARLQQGKYPTTAVCTMTLELGIDIGQVESVAQLTPPASVASLRQRLGRSGRRGDPAILRGFITEAEIEPKSHIVDRLRLNLVQMIAMVRLLVSERWYEPANLKRPHYSTLLHQIISITAQKGGVFAHQLWEGLVERGPFRALTKEQFVLLLRAMGDQELLTQLGSGELTLGIKGESLASHYTFFAVFKTPQEYRVVVNGKGLGTLPADTVLSIDQYIVFAGRKWKIKDVDTDSKVVHVIPAKGGMPPRFGGGGIQVHDRVRQEMYNVLCEGDGQIQFEGQRVRCLDERAQAMFLEGRSTFEEFDLMHQPVIENGANSLIFPWLGDRVANTIATLFQINNINATAYHGIVDVEGITPAEVAKFLLTTEMPSGAQLASIIPDKEISKYDFLVPEQLLCHEYGESAFDVTAAQAWIDQFR